MIAEAGEVLNPVNRRMGKARHGWKAETGWHGLDRSIEIPSSIYSLGI